MCGLDFVIYIFFLKKQSRRKTRFWLVGCDDGVVLIVTSQSSIHNSQSPPIYFYFFDPHPLLYNKKKGWKINSTPFWNLFFFFSLGLLNHLYRWILFQCPNQSGPPPVVMLRRNEKGAGHLSNPYFCLFFGDEIILRNENEKTRICYTKPWYHVLMNVKENDFKMKKKKQTKNWNKNYYYVWNRNRNYSFLFFPNNNNNTGEVTENFSFGE